MRDAPSKGTFDGHASFLFQFNSRWAIPRLGYPLIKKLWERVKIIRNFLVSRRALIDDELVDYDVKAMFVRKPFKMLKFPALPPSAWTTNP